MPEISRFFGIIVTVNYADHLPPHFHARYGEQRALVGLESLALIRGQLSPRALGMITEWAAMHREALADNWSLARHQAPLKKIAPLE